jgi:hypothetical protein
MNLLLWVQQRLSIHKKKKLEEAEGGRGRRNKIACVFGLPVKILFILN